MSQILSLEEWKVLSENRAAVYQWLGSAYATELTDQQWQEYQSKNIQPFFSFLSSIGLKDEINRFENSISECAKDEDALLELSADFATHFLLDDKVSVIPYASLYLCKEKQRFNDVELQMQSFLRENNLAISSSFKEPADHLSVYLFLMNHWIRHEEEELSDQSLIAKSQSEFIEYNLLSWLELYVDQSKRLPLKYDFYHALNRVLLSFIQTDLLLLKSFS